MEMPGAGFELILSRWFKETFWPAYEYYYSDMTVEMTIGPTSTDVYVDMAQDWPIYMWSRDSVPYAPTTWGLESIWGDAVESTPQHPVSEFDPYIRYDNGTLKTYYNVGPGHELYDDYQPYDYTPAVWNMIEGETLIFDVSSVWDRWLDGDKAWVYNQMEWDEDAGETPLDALEVEFGVPYPTLIEPPPEDFPGQIEWSNETGHLTFTGPIDMETWSKENLEAEWLALADEDHPEGILPWGEPILEFDTIPEVPKEYKPPITDDGEPLVLPIELIIAIVVVIVVVAAGTAYVLMRRRKPTPG